MLLTTAVVVILGAIVLIGRTRSARDNDANLGWMSPQWLAEHRASNLP